MKNIDPDEFKRDHAELDALHLRAKEAHRCAKEASSENGRKIALRNLAIVIYDFDEHVIKFIHKYPEYYERHKDHLDVVTEANTHFLNAVTQALSNLSNEKSN
jgi:hypothetical protein